MTWTTRQTLDVHDERGIILATAATPERAARVVAMAAENADLKISVIAFCAPHAVSLAREFGLPSGHLFASHYDILQKAGARMDDFVRHDGVEFV